MSEEDQELVVIDTDAGLDDALALFMLLRAHKEKRLKIIGITCVCGNTSVDNVCVNVTRVLTTAQVSKIPVYRGAYEGLMGKIMRETPPFHGDDGFGDTLLPQLESSIASGVAATQLCQLALKHEGKLNLITLGPLTNIALAMKLDAKFSSRLKSVYIMGGNIEALGNIKICAEFNFAGDPEAAKIVLCGKFPNPINIVPLETCKLRARFPIEWRLQRFETLTSPQAKLMTLIETKKMNKVSIPDGYWVSCDALCAAIFLDPKVAVSSTEEVCTVETTGQFTRGQMILKIAKDTNFQGGPAIVTRTVDLERFGNLILWGLGA